MQEKGLEPSRYCYHRHLKPARLPIPPFLLKTDKCYSNVFILKCQGDFLIFFKMKIAKFNSTIHLYGGILFCTSGI